jgi:hypothetical protein
VTRSANWPPRWRVELSCGHGWVESRPSDMGPPQVDERRACGAPEHYPNQYPTASVTEVPRGKESGMTCVDYARHEVTCPHHGGSQVDWRTADGCSGRLCTACWQTYCVGSWADLEEKIAGPADGLNLLGLLRVVGHRDGRS